MLLLELKWLKGLLLSLRFHHPKSIPLFCDIQYVLHLAKIPIFMNVQNIFRLIATLFCLIDPSHVRTSAQLIDIFTKAHGKSHFELLLSKLGILEHHMLQL